MKHSHKYAAVYSECLQSSSKQNVSDRRRHIRFLLPYRPAGALFVLHTGCYRSALKSWTLQNSRLANSSCCMPLLSVHAVHRYCEWNTNSGQVEIYRSVTILY
jgi:hypothetical protein